MDQTELISNLEEENSSEEPSEDLNDNVYITVLVPRETVELLDLDESSDAGCILTIGWAVTQSVSAYKVCLDLYDHPLPVNPKDSLFLIKIGNENRTCIIYEGSILYLRCRNPSQIITSFEAKRYIAVPCSLVAV